MRTPFDFNPALHGLRCIAAMAVFFFHWGLYFPAGMQWMARIQVPGHPWVNLSLPFALGSEGVPLFFVLSGYLLTSQWIRRSMSWSSIREFYKRRALRIYPAFWVQLVILLCVGYWLPKVFPLYSLQDIALTSLLWINLPPAYIAPMNDVWWTLPVEILFYFVLPSIIYLMRKWGVIRIWIAVLTLTFSWRLGVMNHYTGEVLSSHLAVLDSLPGVLSVFMSGVVIASLQEQLTKYRKQLLYLSIALFFSLQTILVHKIEVYWNGGFLLLVWSTLLSISFAMAIGAVCMHSSPPRWLSNRYMVWMGDMSFGIYLWHFPLILVLHNYWPSMGNNTADSFFVMLGVFLCTLCMASLSFYLVEKPLMNHARRMSQKRNTF